jgi:hypothetical protein
VTRAGGPAVSDPLRPAELSAPSLEWGRDAPSSIRFDRKGGLLSAILVAVALTGCATSPPSLPLSTAPFLGPQDFSGTYTPRSYNATTGGEATYHGNIVFANLDRNLVQAVLPQGLRLAQNSATPGSHPLIYLYGHPTKTQWIINNTPIVIGPDYQELMLLVPFVQADTGIMWHNFVVRMYLDDWNAIWIGNFYFAYAKEWGTSQESGTEVSEFVAGSRYFHADIQTTGPWEPSTQAEGTIPNYKAIQTILGMPIVGRSQSGSLVCSHFELNYDNAMVAPVQSTHEFLQPFKPGMEGWVALGPLSSVPNGAIAIRDLNWRIRQPPPPPCRF